MFGVHYASQLTLARTPKLTAGQKIRCHNTTIVQCVLRFTRVYSELWRASSFAQTASQRIHFPRPFFSVRIN